MSTLWIVSGPSSVGKSRFIHSPRARELTGLPIETTVLFPARIRRDATIAEDAYLHYNILRPAHRAVTRSNGRTPLDAVSYDDDPHWRRVLGLVATRRSILLVAELDTILERVRKRVAVERDRDAVYKAEEWLDLYRRIDLGATYRMWRAELQRQQIAYTELDANRDDYPILRSWP